MVIDAADAGHPRRFVGYLRSTLLYFMK